MADLYEGSLQTMKFLLKKVLCNERKGIPNITIKRTHTSVALNVQTNFICHIIYFVSKKESTVVLITFQTTFLISSQVIWKITNTKTIYKLIAIQTYLYVLLNIIQFPFPPYC